MAEISLIDTLKTLSGVRYRKDNHTSLFSDIAFNVHGKSGSITSPNFPSSYPKNITCTWNITAGVGHILNITFVSMDIENSPDCMKDYIQIQLGRNESFWSKKRYCNSIPNSLSSEDGWAEIQFVADDSFEKSGFKLAWIAAKTKRGLWRLYSLLFYSPLDFRKYTLLSCKSMYVLIH